MKPHESKTFECQNERCKSQFKIVYEPEVKQFLTEIMIEREPVLCPFCAEGKLKEVDINLQLK